MSYLIYRYVKKENDENKMVLFRGWFLAFGIMFSSFFLDGLVLIFPFLPPIYLTQMAFIIFLILLGEILTKHLVDDHNELGKLIPILHGLISEKQDAHDKLEKRAMERNSEITAILKESKQVFFAFDDRAQVSTPISPHTDIFFKGRILNFRISDVLFSNIMPGSNTFNFLKNNLLSVFKNKNINFKDYAGNLPKTLELTIDGNFHQVSVNYSAIYGTIGIVKVLCLIREIDKDLLEYKRKAMLHDFNQGVVESGDNKNKEYCHLVKRSIREIMGLMERISVHGDNLKGFVKLEREAIYKSFKELSKREEMDNYLKEHVINVKRNFSFLLSSQTITQRSTTDLFKNLYRSHSVISFYMDQLSIFGFNEDNEKEEESKIESIKSTISNFLEYCLLIRNKDLTEVETKDLEMGAKNIRNLSKENFYDVVPSLYKKSILQSIIYFKSGDIMEGNLYKHFSEQLEKLPKAEVITPKDLEIYLINPYKNCLDI